MKDGSFWTIKIPQDCTRGWRKMKKLRDEARKFLHYEVGDGTKVFLWHDRWHPDGIFYQKNGHRIIYDAASSFNAKSE